MPKKKVVCIVQARLGSSRLPGKVLLPLKAKPMIVHTFDRLKQCKKIDQIVLATTQLPEDQRLTELASLQNVDAFAGSEHDVLDRFYQAGKNYHAEIVVRCTGDCPVIDHEVADFIIERHMQSENDYTSNTVVRTYPRGLDIEAMNFQALAQAAREAKQPYEREHVTPYIYQHPTLFSLEQVEARTARRQPDLRLTVDVKEDYDFMVKIFDHLYDQNPYFLVDDILKLLEKEPRLKKINSHVKQKPLPQSE